MLKKYLVLSLCFFAVMSESLFAHPASTSRNRGGHVNLSCHHGTVERAGVALVKDFGPSKDPSLRYAVIVGVGRKSTNGASYVNFFAGGCERKDKYSTVTAAEELYEETGMAVDIPANALQGKPYTYNTTNKTQLFWSRQDNVSVDGITKALSTAHTNKKLSYRFKENKAACAIPLQDILNRARYLAQRSAQGQDIRARNHYIFKTRGNGDGTGRKDVYLDPQYMRSLVRDAGNLGHICSQLTYGYVR